MSEPVKPTINHLFHRPFEILKNIKIEVKTNITTNVKEDIPYICQGKQNE